MSSLDGRYTTKSLQDYGYAAVKLFSLFFTITYYSETTENRPRWDQRNWPVFNKYIYWFKASN